MYSTATVRVMEAVLEASKVLSEIPFCFVSSLLLCGCFSHFFLGLKGSTQSPGKRRKDKKGHRAPRVFGSLILLPSLSRIEAKRDTRDKLRVGRPETVAGDGPTNVSTSRKQAKPQDAHHNPQTPTVSQINSQPLNAPMQTINQPTN